MSCCESQLRIVSLTLEGSKVNRRTFLKATTLAAAAVSCNGMPVIAATKRRKPNFVIILADDMGFSDAGCYGGEIETPVFDSLAAGGTRYTGMYSAGRCGPSRSCLMTGMYAQQTSADVMTPGKIPDYVSFIPQHLKKEGYRSYHSGKWHLRIDPLAEGVGFDHSYTMLDEWRFFTQKKHELDDTLLPPPPEGYYSTTAIADYAVGFLKEHQEQHSSEPFFLYIAFHAPHFPLQAPQEDIDQYRGRFDDGWDKMRERRHKKMLQMGLVNCGLAKMEPDVYPPWNQPESELIKLEGPGEVARAVPWDTLNDEQKKFESMKMSIHAAMVTRMDKETGKIIDQIKSMGQFDDTVIIFLSDNGASAEELIRGDGHDRNAPPGSAKTHLSIGPGWATASDTPLRLHKSYVHEGGIASPFIVHWTNGLKNKGKLRHDVCHFVDIAPTFVELAGGGAKQDGGGWTGKCLAPTIVTNSPVDRPYLYFNHANNRALRTKDWKLIARGQTGPWELYDMKVDRCEQKDLASAKPELAKSMEDQWSQADRSYAQQRDAAKTTTLKMGPKSNGA